MKFAVYIFGLLCCFENAFSQTSGIVWQKDLVPNFNNSHSGVIYQGITTDSLRNIYFAYSLNGSDTTSSFISKLSPNGELLWRRTLLPNFDYHGIYTQFDRHTKLYIDNDEKLVFCAKGYDTATSNELLLFKFDLNGNLISKAGKANVTTLLTADIMDIIVDPNNGNIYFPLYEMGDDSTELIIHCFDKNFNYQFDKKVKFYSGTNGNLYAPSDCPVLTIIDSLLFIQTHDVQPDYTVLQCANLYNNTVKFTYSDNRYLHMGTAFKIGGAYLLAGASGFFKFDENGNKFFEHIDPHGIRNPAYENGFIYYNTIVTTGAGGWYMPVNSYYRRYDVVTDSIYSNLTEIPQINSPIAYIVSKKLNNLYSYGAVLDDTIKAFNGVKTYFFAKHDTDGNTVDYFFSTLTNSGWTQDQLKTCIDRNNDFVGFQTVLKPNDTSASRFFNYIIKGSFNRKINLKGVCYYDENNNCMQDSTESGIPNNLIRLMPEDIYTTTDSLGNYSFTSFDSIAKIEIIPINNMELCDTLYNVSCLDTIIHDSLNFAYNYSNSLFCKSSIHSFKTVRGFNALLSCYVHNLNFFPLHNIELSVTLDSAFQFYSSNTVIDSVIANTIYFHLDSLGILQNKVIEIIVYIPPNTPLGYSYSHRLMSLFTNEESKCISIDSTTGVVVGSFDPNDKIVEPQGKGPNNIIPNNTTLKYTIRFQNTGTDTAIHIRIFDKLDENLDISTFNILAQSHPLTFTLENRLAKFNFKNINLPDSSQNQNASNGFVVYSIKPKENIDGIKILNNADIYFDFNTPITTNTASLTIGNYVEPEIVYPFNFICYPNPARNSELTIQLDINVDDTYSIILTDLVGRSIKSIVHDNVMSEGTYFIKVDLKGMSEGIYLIQLQSKMNNIKYSKKLVIGS